jgi:putative flippase GtrA
MNIKQKAANLPDIQKQIIKFGMIGLLATLVDFLAYGLLLKSIPIFEVSIDFIGEQFRPNNEDLCKTLSFIIGSMVTYNLNKFWTWRQNNRSKRRFVKFYTLYGVSLVVNVLANKFALYLLESQEVLEWVPRKFVVAFIFATGMSAIFNFIGQKTWVFSTRNDEN